MVDSRATNDQAERVSFEQKRQSLARGRRLVLLAGILWSFSGVVTKSIDLDSLTIAFYRSLFAGIALLPFISRNRISFRPIMLPLGIGFGMMTGLYLGSVKMTTAANAIYLQYTATFWVLPLGMLLLGEIPDRRSSVGVSLAMAGIGLIVAWGYDGRPDEWKGIALGLGSGISYAIVAIGMRGLRGVDSLWLSSVLNLLASMTLGIVLVIRNGGSPVLPRSGEILVLFAFGVIQMAIPYYLFAKGLREVDAAEAGLIALIEPILNPIWVVLVVHEWPTIPTLVGGALLLGGVACKYWPVRIPVSAKH